MKIYLAGYHPYEVRGIYKHSKRRLLSFYSICTNDFLCADVFKKIIGKKNENIFSREFPSNGGV